MVASLGQVAADVLYLTCALPTTLRAAQRTYARIRTATAGPSGGRMFGTCARALLPAADGKSDGHARYDVIAYAPTARTIRGLDARFFGIGSLAPVDFVFCAGFLLGSTCAAVCVLRFMPHPALHACSTSGCSGCARLRCGVGMHARHAILLAFFVLVLVVTTSIAFLLFFPRFVERAGYAGNTCGSCAFSLYT